MSLNAAGLDPDGPDEVGHELAEGPRAVAETLARRRPSRGSSASSRSLARAQIPAEPAWMGSGSCVGWWPSPTT